MPQQNSLWIQGIRGEEMYNQLNHFDILTRIYWCTDVRLPFVVYFHDIWYVDGWVSVTKPMCPIKQNWLNWV